MKQLKITVNGKSYDVTVEELGGVATPVQAPVAAPQVQAAPAPQAAPAVQAAPAEAPAAAPAAQTAGEGEPVNAPMNGNIVDVKVSAGQTVKSGDVLVVLEAMKMENEIMSPKDGVISAVCVTKGETVDTGKTLVTIQ